MKKRVLAMLLALLLLCGLLPFPAGAAELKTYAAVGDSIAAGYSFMFGMDDLPKYLMHQNYAQARTDCYPVRFGEQIGAENVYDLGILGAWASDYVRVLTDPGFIPPFYRIFAEGSYRMEHGEIDGEDFAHTFSHHFLALAALREADIISVQLGGNDLVHRTVFQALYQLATGEECAESEPLQIKPLAGRTVRNPLAAAVLAAVETYFGSDTFPQMPEPQELLRPILETYLPQIRPEHLTELADFLSAEKLNARMRVYSESVANAYDALARLFREGCEISRAEYDALQAAYAEADARLASASREAARGEISEYRCLREGRLSLFTEGDRCFIAPINPDAELLFIGLYNPFGQKLTLGKQEGEELLAYLGRIVQYVGDAVSETGMAAPNPRMRGMPVMGVPTLCPGRQNVGIASTDSLLEDIPIALLYPLLGQALEGVVDQHNARISAVAECWQVPFADVSAMPSPQWADVHPNAAGHAYIAERMAAVLTSEAAPAAMIGRTGYASLAAAVEAAKNGDIIRLVGKNSEQITVSRAVSFTLLPDRQGFSGKLTAAEGYARTGFGNVYTFAKVRNLCPTTVCAPKKSALIPWGWCPVQGFGKFSCRIF